MSRTPYYDKLSPGERLAIERLLHERVFGRPFEARRLPENPTAAQQDHLAACIREAIQHGNDGARISRATVEATRELTASLSHFGPPTHLRTPQDLRRNLLLRMTKLRAGGRLPHELDPEPAFEWDREIPKEEIAEKRLAAIGFRRAPDRCEAGRLACDKLLGDGQRISCDLDFGEWRRTVMAMWVYTREDVHIALPLDYSASGQPAPIIDRELFEQTMDNIAFVAAELEHEIGQSLSAAA